MLFYTHDSEPAGASIVKAFSKDFPRSRAGMFGAQNGALFSKVLAERSAGKYNVDVIQFSEPSTALDFQNAVAIFVTSRLRTEFYAPDHLSTPVGDYFWIGVTFAGIARNTDKVPADAPKVWKDVLESAVAQRRQCQQSTIGHAVRSVNGAIRSPLRRWF